MVMRVLMGGEKQQPMPLVGGEQMGADLCGRSYGPVSMRQGERHTERRQVPADMNSLEGGGGVRHMKFRREETGQRLGQATQTWAVHSTVQKCPAAALKNKKEWHRAHWAGCATQLRAGAATLHRMAGG